jgi:hemoglobin
MTTSVPSPQLPPYTILGGEPTVRALVERFYDQMDLDPRFARLRAVHGATLNEARTKLYEFLSGWLGGPPIYIEKYGHPRLRARHLPFRIGTIERDQWLACMGEAMDELGVTGPVRDHLNQSFSGTADWMRNVDE